MDVLSATVDAPGGGGGMGISLLKVILLLVNVVWIFYSATLDAPRTQVCGGMGVILQKVTNRPSREEC